jgi:hypothetical protein
MSPHSPDCSTANHCVLKHLTGNQYSWAGSIFYFSYLIFSYPASMIMVRLPIAKFIALTV